MNPNRRALLDTIRFAEGTWRGGSQEGYRVMFGGGLADPDPRGGGHPDTVINGGRVSSAAAGAYQFMPDTWTAAARAVGVKPNQFFDPAAQDKAADYLVSRRLGGAQLGDSLTPEIASRLAPEWASFPTAGGGSYYPNQSVKKLGELDSFYRQRLAVLRGGGGTEALASTPAPQGGEPMTAAMGSSSSMDLAKALFGDLLAPAAAPAAAATGGIRMAAVDTAPVVALTGMDGTRKAGAAVTSLDSWDAANDPFVVAVSRRPDGVATAPAQAPDLVLAGKATAPATTAAASQQLLDGEMGIVDIGKKLEGIGFKVAENPHFGDRSVGGHSPNSHHNVGHAIDVTAQPWTMKKLGLPDGEWRRVTTEWGEKLAKAFPEAEVLHPGNDPNHKEHIHIGFPGGKARYSQFAKQLGLA